MVRSQRGVSITLDPAAVQWVDALVEALEQAGYPMPARSEVVRMGLIELRELVKGKTPTDVAKHFAQRHAGGFVAAVGETESGT